MTNHMREAFALGIQAMLSHLGISTAMRDDGSGYPMLQLDDRHTFRHSEIGITFDSANLVLYVKRFANSEAQVMRITSSPEDLIRHITAYLVTQKAAQVMSLLDY